MSSRSSSEVWVARASTSRSKSRPITAANVTAPARRRVPAGRRGRRSRLADAVGQCHLLERVVGDPTAGGVLVDRAGLVEMAEHLGSRRTGCRRSRGTRRGRGQSRRRRGRDRRPPPSRRSRRCRRVRRARCGRRRGAGAARPASRRTGASARAHCRGNVPSTSTRIGCSAATR